MRIEQLHILVAEDHEFQRKTLMRMLAAMGASIVSGAGDGKAALDIFTGAQPPVDIIISDLEMPGMDGMEFMRHLGEIDRPVAVILSSALDENLISSVEAMTTAYGITLLGAVSKPVTRDKLLLLLNKFQPPKPKVLRPPAVDISLDDMRRGLKAGEFLPFFQPKVGLSGGSVIGVEALARWKHPQKGLIAPYAFIPAMEKSGMIDDLTWIMLEESAKHCGEWVRQGQPLTVSVNLSLTSLAEAGLAERIIGCVSRHNVSPKHIVLEITESAAMTDVGKALENLTRLRMKGFSLSIDDYGTGYSSIQQLSRIPFSELKIDQSFVFSALEREASKVILSSSLEMARKLGLQAVAEGVETRAHWNLLQQLGCDIAQGYFIAKPMDCAAFEDWMLTWIPPD